MNVLIVDDHPTNLKLLRYQLEAEGHAVVDAPDGVAALDMLQELTVDAVISDILMPRMDGYRLCYEVRKRERLRHLPFIIYTATYMTPSDEKLALDVGADKYLRKPAAMEVIGAALHEVSGLAAMRRLTPEVTLPEAELMKSYSERLVNKLEEKNTQLSEALAHLQANEARLLRLEQSIEGMLEGIQIIDRQWRYVYVNGSAARQGRHSSAELVGRTIIECYPGIADSLLVEAMTFVMDSRLPRRMQNEFKFADGTTAWFEVSIEPDPNGILVRSIDITQHKQAEEVLLKAGALQSAIFKSVNFSCIATDAKGVIQIFNAGAERMTGYSAAEVVNRMTPSDLHDPREVISRASTLSLEFGTPIAPGFESLTFKASRGIEDIYELTSLCKDGTRFPAVVSVTALRDERGIIGYLRVGHDNTARHQVEEDRKRAQEALRESEARFRAFVTASSDVVYRMSADWSEMRQLHGHDFIVDTEKPTGTWLLEYIHADDQPHVMAAIGDAIRTKTRFELEHRVRRVDGSLGWTLSRAIPLLDAEGSIIEWFGTASDVTKRKLTEEALRQSEARFQTIVENLTEGLVVSDLNGQMLHFNRAALDLYGFRNADQGRRHLTELADMFELSGMDGRIWHLHEWPLARILRGETIRNLEASFRPLDTDRKRVFSYGGSLVREADGKPLMAIVTITDITDRKRFEHALQETNVKLEAAKSTAEKANLAKSDFLSSMSHELRSPLNAILGFAQLMESGSPLPTDAQGKSIAQILQAGWYLLKLINEILDLTAIESGNVSLSPESVSLSELMAECESMMEPQAQQRGITLTFPRIDRAVGVITDRTRLKQIVINLLSNAIKYNKENGAVVVDCTVVAPERIRISVKDTGAGLPPEMLAQLFSPFNRLGQETGSVSGTGIGLVVSKRLAELMGGVIGVESTVGVGSNFWCEVISAAASPAAVEGSKVASFQPDVSANAARRTLLYVEDNPANMQLIAEIIGRLPDIKLLTAVDATLGIELARTTSPQVILMDINLPGISGIKALKILRQDPATAHIPIIALSANAMPRDIVRGLEVGFFRYLTKPIKVKEFVDTLHAALDSAETTADQST